MSDFKDKVAVVTGAAQGIGRQIAIQFAQEGAHPVIVDYNEEKGQATADEISEKYCEALFIKADVSSYEDNLRIREETFKKFGRVDILVANAAIGMKHKIHEITPEVWQKILNINLNGYFYLVSAFYNDFTTNKGSIVFVSSGSALSGTGGSAAYCAAKAGGEGFSRALAKELGPLGVNVNIVAPRLIDSGPMMRVNYPTQADLDAVIQKIPVRHWGENEDVANAVLFLASKKNSYIHGQTLYLDGGRTVG